MKKFLVRYLPALVPAIGLFVHVQAQSAKLPLELNLKEFIFNAAKANEVVEPEGSAATARATKDFNRRFGYTGKAAWFEIRDGFAVRFETGGIDTKAYYDHEGRWYATIRSYGQDKMPKQVRALVRSTYYDYAIYQVNEVTVEDRLIYLVKIEDEKNFKTIRVTDSGMDVYEEYRKI